MFSEALKKKKKKTKHHNKHSCSCWLWEVKYRQSTVHGAAAVTVAGRVKEALTMPKFHQCYACSTFPPLGTIKVHTLQPQTLDPVMIDGTALHTAANHFTFYQMDAQAVWDYSRPADTLQLPACSLIPEWRSIHYLTSFITAQTDPINFKSLSGTWGICPMWIHGVRMQAI